MCAIIPSCDFWVYTLYSCILLLDHNTCSILYTPNHLKGKTFMVFAVDWATTKVFCNPFLGFGEVFERKTHDWKMLTVKALNCKFCKVFLLE